MRRAIYSKMGKLSKSDISELCPSIGVKSVELALKQLVDEGVLEKKGLGRATFGKNTTQITATQTQIMQMQTPQTTRRKTPLK